MAPPAKREAPDIEPLLDILLGELGAIRDCLETFTEDRVTVLRRYGVSWEAIAAAMGEHRYTVTRRFKSLVEQRLVEEN